MGLKKPDLTMSQSESVYRALSGSHGRQKDTRERKELRQFVRRKTIKYVDLEKSLTPQTHIIAAIMRAINKRFPYANYTLKETFDDVTRQRRSLRLNRGLVKRRAAAGELVDVKEPEKPVPLKKKKKKKKIRTTARLNPDKATIAIMQPGFVRESTLKRVSPFLVKAQLPPRACEVTRVVQHDFYEPMERPFDWIPDAMDNWIEEKDL